LVANGHFGT